MKNEVELSKRQVERVIADLESLCQKEYGLTLEAVRFDANREVAVLRLQRLTGILLKRRFARARTRTPKQPESQTGAKRFWKWDRRKLASGVGGADAELALLNRLRGPGAWNESWEWAAKEADGTVLTWDAFTADVDSERGLFKVVALYLMDVLASRDRQTIGEYYRARESETVKRSLDLATLLTEAAVLGPIYAAIGVPSVAVALVLFLADVGAAQLFSDERSPDDYT